MPRRRPTPTPRAPEPETNAPDAPRLTDAEIDKLYRRHAYLLTHRARDHEMAVLVWMRLAHRVPGPPDVERVAAAARGGWREDDCWHALIRLVRAARGGAPDEASDP